MNDRYLYRAKRKNWREFPKEKWWVTGYLVNKKCGEYNTVGFEEFEEMVIVTQFSDGGIDWCYIEKDTICQCTGLKDKNGKLIWENDIVCVKHTDGQEEYQENAKVSYTKRGFSPFSWEYYCDGCDVRCEILEVEVIGNIFDNPELFEQKGCD